MRRLIVCCDGTWNSADSPGGKTNVVRLVQAIKPVGNEGIAQIVYYHPGVGTGDVGDRISGGATGIGLSHNVRDAYAFLANNYAVGDEIFLFGFSRGAYTARCIGGLIGEIGLLPKEDMGNFLNAWAYYRLSSDERDTKRSEFERWFPHRKENIPIKVIGVWDTVGAMGIPDNRFTGDAHVCQGNYKFENVTLGKHVENAFQALAIDEERKPFEPAVWTRHAAAPVDQILRQVWFAGVHSDIGGGYPEHGASDLAYLWLVAEVTPFLTLDQRIIFEQLDYDRPLESSPLHNSRTFFWRIIGGPLHRAVCGTATEFLHQSVVDRVNAGDGYRDKNFIADKPVFPLTPFEIGVNAVVRAGPKPSRGSPPTWRRPTFCDWLLAQLGGS